MIRRLALVPMVLSTLVAALGASPAFADTPLPSSGSGGKASAPGPVFVPSSNSTSDAQNLSALHFGKSGDAKAHASEAPDPDFVAPSPLRGTFRSGVRAPRWSSSKASPNDPLALGARSGTMTSLGLSEEQTSKPMNGSLDGAATCTTPDLIGGGDCCSYGMKNQLGNYDEVYRRPKHAFGDLESAKALAASVRAGLPMFLPFRHPDVKLAQGWIYDNGGFHGALDYVRMGITSGEDPTFKIHAAATGKVIAVYWDNLMGNVIIVDHKSLNGKDRYRTVYVHMRDGLDHDVQMARAISIPADKQFKDGKPTRAWKYKQFANKPNPNPLWWGAHPASPWASIGSLKVGRIA
jgi:hypothetical protein